VQLHDAPANGPAHYQDGPFGDMRTGETPLPVIADRRTAASPLPHFRKVCRSRFRSHLPQIQPLAKSPRACLEGPFGEVLRATGPLAKANPFRFSTKYQDDETDIVWYPYRPWRDGRFLSRDPIEEDGGDNLYGFVNNNPVNATDPLGLVIETSCDPIDDYLKSLGVSFARTGSYRYTFSGTDLGTGDASAKMIVTRMLFTKHVFKISSSGSATANLKRHVDARLTIVRNALNANFLFGTGHRLDWAGFRDNAQAFFDKLNNGETVIACQALSRIIFETGNDFGKENGGTWAEGHRPYDFVWIPGDWGKIDNRAYVRGIWEPGLEGENVFHTGRSADGEMFWGHFKPGKHPSMSEHEWWDEVKSWTGGGEHGDPHWRNDIKYPVVGLER
jgi:RHS repeat-associated protein